jgi:hypothetical protein
LFLIKNKSYCLLHSIKLTAIDSKSIIWNFWKKKNASGIRYCFCLSTKHSLWFKWREWRECRECRECILSKYLNFIHKWWMSIFRENNSSQIAWKNGHIFYFLFFIFYCLLFIVYLFCQDFQMIYIYSLVLSLNEWALTKTLKNIFIFVKIEKCFLIWTSQSYKRPKNMRNNLFWENK